MQLRKYADGILKKARNYRDRLIKYAVITDSHPFLQVDLLTCPLCHARLESCIDCNAVVACPSHNCLAAVAIEGHWCDDPTTTFSSQHCLDTKGLDATIVQCPTCHLWRYGIDLDWCSGRIAQSAEELASLSELDQQLLKQSHPRKPGPCRHIVEAGIAPKWQYCDGNIGVCPSKPRLSGHHQGSLTYCMECVAKIQGRSCVCGLTWTCNVYTEDYDSILSLYTTCPRCERTFCQQHGGCKCCQMCCTCLQPGLCHDCVEEEAVLGEDKSVVTFVELCDHCRGHICEGCSSRILECPFCKDRVCGQCTDPSHCPDCKVPICMRCSTLQYQEIVDDTLPCPPKPGSEQ